MSSELTIDRVHKLIYRGIEMGLLHVCAGPDHLSALATLSSNNSWRAVSLGIRWGAGHSAALIIVTIIFLILKGNLDLHLMERYANGFVGFFMIILGLFGVRQAYTLHKEKQDKRNEEIDHHNNSNNNNDGAVENGEKLTLIDTHSNSDDINSDDNNNNNNRLLTPGQLKGKEREKGLFDSVSMKDPWTQQLVAFSIGIVHGVAGPGGVLGVLPAVEMTNPSASLIYLSAFVFTSTICMGIFAAAYGEATKRLSTTTEKMEFILSCFSSCVSVLVGIIWLSLSLAGKLQDFFD